MVFKDHNSQPKGEKGWENMSVDKMDIQLDEEEQWFEDHFEEFVPADPGIRQKLMEAAAQPPRIERRKQMISIRLDPQDVRILKEKAERAGLAYQTMVSSLLHQYAMGDLVNVEEARKILRR